MVALCDRNIMANGKKEEKSMKIWYHIMDVIFRFDYEKKVLVEQTFFNNSVSFLIMSIKKSAVLLKILTSWRIEI